MEDYIQGIVCGYLTVQNGTKEDAKRRRMFIVLSDMRIDHYTTDPRPEFEETITDTYLFGSTTQIHHYAEINPRAPANSFCLITDKTTDVYIAESHKEAQVWFTFIEERLEALAQMVQGTLMMRQEMDVTQQFQRKLLGTKYKWYTRSFELGRSTLRYSNGKHQDQKRQSTSKLGNQGRSKKRNAKNAKVLKQFNLTCDSYVSEDTIEILTPVGLASFMTSRDGTSLTPEDLKRLQNGGSEQQVKERQQKVAGKNGIIVYPFVICTGVSHLYLAALTEASRNEWITAIRMRVISLKHQRKGENRDVGSTQQLDGFMEVQFVVGGPWKRKYVELSNDMLKVKTSERNLGAKFETRLLPTCEIEPSLVKANAFQLRNMGQSISLAPGTLQESQHWMRAIREIASSVPLVRYQKIFDDDLRDLLDHSVVYTVDVADGAKAGLLVEKYKKRIFVLSHTFHEETKQRQGSIIRRGSVAIASALTGRPASASASVSSPAPVATVPEGSVLVGITQVGMVHDSFETIWHKLRHKRKDFNHTMTLTFRVPMTKMGLLEVKTRSSKDTWTLRRCVLANGKFRIHCIEEPTTTNQSTSGAAESNSTSNKIRNPTPLLLELPLRECHIEFMSYADAGARHAMKIVVDKTGAAVHLRAHSDNSMLAWFGVLQLEISVAQVDPRYPLSMGSLLANVKATPPTLAGSYEDQKRTSAKCKIAKVLLSETERTTIANEPKLLGLAYKQGNWSFEDGALLSAIHVNQGLPLTEEDVTQFFMHLDVIGCGKISAMALSSTIDNLARQFDEKHRSDAVGPFRQALSTLGLIGKSISLDQATEVIRNICDPQLCDLVRKYYKHEVQFM